MSGTCQATYIVDEKTALYWWRALPGNYFVYRLSKEGELQNPEKIENYNPQYGVEWKVGVENDLEDTVLISSWQPKKHPSSIWRVDIHWNNEKVKNIQTYKVIVLTVENCLVALGAQSLARKKTLRNEL